MYQQPRINYHTQHTLKCFVYISEWGKKLQYHKKHNISSKQYLNSGQKLRFKINKFQKLLPSARRYTTQVDEVGLHKRLN